MLLKLASRICIAASYLLVVLISPQTDLFAQPVPESTKNLIHFNSSLQPQVVRNGETFKLVIDVSLEPGWHIYSVVPSEAVDAPKPTRVRLLNDRFKSDGPVYETKPLYRYEELLKFGYYYHKKRAELYQNLTFRNIQEAGSYTEELEIKYQLCTETICLPTESRVEKLVFEVQPGEPRKEQLIADRSINPLPSQQVVNDPVSMFSEGLWAFLALAALMGFASLLTPCVFPMIPITITYFSKQAEGSQKQVIKLALLFSAGIIVTYTGFGLLMSIVFGAGSALSVAANPYVNLLIALVFILFAFSLMGVFTIKLPSGIENYFDTKARSLGGAVGVLLMGFTFTLTAFTCTVQFVGTMLIAASQGEWIWPLIGMLVFSGVFAFPFFLLAVSPSLIKKLQGKSGEWLGRSKFVLGILELMASVKFLSNADLVWQTNFISRNTAIFIWMLLLGFVVLYLIWTGIRPRFQRSFWQWLSVLGFCLLIFLLSNGWNDKTLGSLIDAVLPPPSGDHVISDDFVSNEESSLVWLTDLEKAKHVAGQSGKRIFLEFTGYTCVNCRWMEQNVLARRTIHNELQENFIPVRLYTDGGDDAKRNLNLQIDQFKTVALPFYVILDSRGRIEKHFSGISIDTREFYRFLTE